MVKSTIMTDGFRGTTGMAARTGQGGARSQHGAFPDRVAATGEPD